MPKKTNETIEKKEILKKEVPIKKNTAKRVSTSVAKKTSSSKSSSSSKVSTKKATKSTSLKSKETTKKIDKLSPLTLEYYDLPYKYNQTIVRILAQTPKTLFVYWELSEKDSKSYIKKYGDDFFTATYPVLIIHNIDKNYTFEIPINDFANSWYFNVDDAKCKYSIELGRRFYTPSEILSDNYMFVASSNKIEAPNNHILFDKAQEIVYFRNVKTNEVSSKNVSNLQFIKYISKIYNIYDVYRKIYKDETILDITNNPTSSFK